MDLTQSFSSVESFNSQSTEESDSENIIRIGTPDIESRAASPTESNQSSDSETSKVYEVPVSKSVKWTDQKWLSTLDRPHNRYRVRRYLSPAAWVRGQQVPYKTRVNIHCIHALHPTLEATAIGKLVSLSKSTVQHILAFPPTPKKRTRSSHAFSEPIKCALQHFINTGGRAARLMPLPDVIDHLGLDLSLSTMRKHLRALGYGRFKARGKPFLDDRKKATRFAWGKAHEHWTLEDWMNVIFTDECAMQCGDNSFYVTRKPGEEFLDDCLRPVFRKLNMAMIYGGICFGGKSQLVLHQADWGNARGNVTALTYVNHMLPAISDFRADMLDHQSSNVDPEDRRDYIVMQDGAKIHTAKISLKFFKDESIPLLDWPPSSPDMNPIEHLWNTLKRAVRKRLHADGWVQENLERFVQEEWDNLDQDVIDNLIVSMPERVQALVAAEGGHTRY